MLKVRDHKLSSMWPVLSGGTKMPPRDKPATIPPPIPAYPTNTKMTSIGFPAIDKLPASGPVPAGPAPTGNTGKVTAPAPTGNTGKVSNATTLGMPAIDRKPDPALLNTLRGLNPWVDQADLDHHGYGVIEATTKGLSSRFVRMQTIKARTRATLPRTGYEYQLDRGQKSIKGVNGPPAA